MLEFFLTTRKFNFLVIWHSLIEILNPRNKYHNFSNKEIASYFYR